MSSEFWSNVEKTDTCWNWVGSTTPDGYGRAVVDGTRWWAHRYAYTTIIGEIPSGLVIDHLCRNRACCNPAHLEPVTHRENVLRGVGVTALNAVKTHCKRGHELTPENVYLAPSRPNERKCRECMRLQVRARNDQLIEERAAKRLSQPPRPLDTHCKQGHEYTDENTIVTPDGRKCRICRAEYNRSYNRAYYLKNKAAKAAAVGARITVEEA